MQKEGFNFKQENMKEPAAAEEYLKILKDTDYAIWYWRDRRKVLTALKKVVEAVNQAETAYAIGDVCVSSGAGLTVSDPTQ